ncbi:copper amine oxidase N-terminal domain-containing protein [Paenibacillus silvisoli]|uniref:copper amine oxidase N-terminal domain-containing protein n=1 Tax=Paenibacillus silvisoli TaxID=3110539 RepID=UPI0028054E3E|nr:copper amine oxidase N-terminal domain-containing protein [Paenibacillus silvisoli]
MVTGGSPGTAASAHAITVELNGQVLPVEHPPLLKSGATLIPLRNLLESLNIDVQWEPAKGTVTLHRWNRTVRLGIGQNSASLQDRGQTLRHIQLSAPAQLVGNVTYVPLRFLSESFGAEVAWNGQEQKIRVRTKSPVDSKAWEYRIAASVTKRTSEEFGGLAEVKQKIVKQFEAVNQKFRVEAFEGTPRFTIHPEDIYLVEGDGRQEALTKDHPKHEFMVIYDAFPDGGGGWYGGEVQSIYHAWPTGDFGSLFDSAATDGLVHEFAHAIGNALDLYALNVEAERNPISGKGYKPERSIMAYPYGETVWDDHTTAAINKAGGYPVLEDDRFTAEQFPDRMEIAALDRDGRPLSEAKVRLYPVAWYSGEVQKTPIRSGQTNGEGVWQLETNPFEPFYNDSPWAIRYANFLVEAELADGSKGYEWMPINQVQLHRYRFPNEPYRLEVRI